MVASTPKIPDPNPFPESNLTKLKAPVRIRSRCLQGQSLRGVKTSSRFSARHQQELDHCGHGADVARNVGQQVRPLFRNAETGKQCAPSLAHALAPAAADRHWGARPVVAGRCLDRACAEVGTSLAAADLDGFFGEEQRLDG